jgi:hypothetical protein
MESSVSKNATELTLSKYLTKAEKQFAALMQMDELDEQVFSSPLIAAEFEQTLVCAMESAFGSSEGDDLNHLFLQRILYRINRLKFFWFDDLGNYKNERSEYLRRVRNRIESGWQKWESSQLNFEAGAALDLADALRRRAERDVTPSPSAEGIFFRDHMGVSGYRRLLEIASLDGLVEASQLSRTLGGVANDIHAMMTRLLVEEYGGGRFSRKHSSFFRLMLEEFGLSTLPEAYFEVVPWEILATVNHSFLLSERKLFYLRYVGGLLYTEISVPAAFNNYRLAAERLGMSEKARAYWDLHIKEDERHGRWMLNDVALPLARMYPRNALELVLGYDQQKFMSERAGKATAKAVRQMDYADRTSSVTNEASFEVAA